MKTAPYFAFYASDTMADKRYRSMSLDERGLLITMMCECWVNHSLPADKISIGKWLGFKDGEIEGALTDRVLTFFSSEKGELICPEIEKYRKKILDSRESKSKGGKKGANKRWRKAEDDGSPIGSPNSISMGRWKEKNRIEKTRSDSQESADNTTNDTWINEYERASRGE